MHTQILTPEHFPHLKENSGAAAQTATKPRLSHEQNPVAEVAGKNNGEGGDGTKLPEEKPDPEGPRIISSEDHSNRPNDTGEGFDPALHTDVDDDTLMIQIPVPGLHPLMPTSCTGSHGLTALTIENGGGAPEKLPLRLATGICTICLSAFEVGSDIVWSSNAACEHVFHEECIEKWLMKQREGPLCPCCRRDFIVDPYDVEEGGGDPPVVGGERPGRQDDADAVGQEQYNPLFAPPSVVAVVAAYATGDEEGGRFVDAESTVTPTPPSGGTLRLVDVVLDSDFSQHSCGSAIHEVVEIPTEPTQTNSGGTMNDE